MIIVGPHHGALDSAPCLEYASGGLPQGSGDTRSSNSDHGVRVAWSLPKFFVGFFCYQDSSEPSGIQVLIQTKTSTSGRKQLVTNEHLTYSSQKILNLLMPLHT